MEILKNIKFDNGWKIATVIVVGIVQGTLAWIKIQETAKQVERNNEQMKDKKRNCRMI